MFTPLTAFCLVGSGCDCVAGERQSAQPVVERATEGRARVDTVFLAVQCNNQAENPQHSRVGAPNKSAQSLSEDVQNPTFLQHRLLFLPNGASLTAASRNTLKCTAAWLREHHEGRILSVGYCDASGSETCTSALAERRGDKVRRFLVSLGTRPDQIAGVKGWDNLDHACRVDTAKCQQLNRSARLFLKSSDGSPN